MVEKLIPESFHDNLKIHFNPEVVQKVLDGLNSKPSISVRNNPNKIEPNYFEGATVPWSEYGITLSERPLFSHDPLFHAGCYYVKDSSSMILEYVLKQLSFDLDNGILGLDMCAAPGGKTLIASDFIGDDGLLLSNEIEGKRNAILRENVLKWGRSNVMVTQLKSSMFSDFEGIFDLIILDAPCSGEGMFRKDSYAIEQWSESLISQCQSTQTALLNDLIPTIKSGGYLIYSTCTMNPKENENQVSSLLKKGFELVDLNLEKFNNYLVPGIKDEKIHGYYLLPGISTGEGLFISALKKTEQARTCHIKSMNFQSITKDVESLLSPIQMTHKWQPDQILFALNDPKEVSNRIPNDWRLKWAGIPIAEQKGKLLLPYHGLAMHPSAKPDIYLDREEALNYLRKERISAVAKNNDSWQKVGYKGHCLGWVKQVPGRWNNYYPSNYRLRT